MGSNAAIKEDEYFEENHRRVAPREMKEPTWSRLGKAQTRSTCVATQSRLMFAIESHFRCLWQR